MLLAKVSNWLPMAPVAVDRLDRPDRAAAPRGVADRDRRLVDRAQSGGGSVGRVTVIADTSSGSEGSGVKLAHPVRRHGRQPDLEHLVVVGRRLGGRDQQRVDRVARSRRRRCRRSAAGFRRRGCRPRSCRGRPARSATTFNPAARLPSSWMRARRSKTCGAMLRSLGMSPRAVVARAGRTPTSRSRCPDADDRSLGGSRSATGAMLSTVKS